MKTLFYNIVGIVSFSFGILGVFLPLVPTTCFMLLAAWAFSKSSPTFHAWLYFKSPFSTSIQNWQQHRVIPASIKWIACGSMIVSYSITCYFINNAYLLIGLGIGLLLLITYIITKPGQVLVATYLPHHVLHQPIR